MTHTQIVDVSYRWLKSRTSVTLNELVPNGGEVPDVIGFMHSYSVLIECKSSRQDFLRDKKKVFRRNPDMGMGNYRFYSCPENMIKVEELPEKWGLLYIVKGRVKVIKNCINEKGGNIYLPGNYFSADRENERAIMFSVLRRINKAHDLHDLIRESL